MIPSRFVPSPYSSPAYGAEEASTPVATASGEPAPTTEEAGYDEYFDYFNQVAPGISQMIFGKDDRERQAILEARIENIKLLKKQTSSALMRTVYQMQLNKLQAQLSAVRTQAKEQQFQETAIKAGQVAMVGLGVFGVVVLIQAATYFKDRRLQEHQLRMAQLKALTPS